MRPALPPRLAVLTALLAFRAGSAVAQGGTAPAYRAAQFACAGIRETARTELETQSGGRQGTATTGRDGVLRLAGREDSGGVAIEAWYDSLGVWRTTGGATLAPDADGVLGGRFRGLLAPDGAWSARARPFVPDEVREVTDLAAVLDDLLPRLPPRPLAIGERWRPEGPDGGGREIERLADSAGGRVERYRVTREVDGEPVAAPDDSLLGGATRSVEDRGVVAWDPARGLLRYDRRLEVQLDVPPGPGRRALRSLVRQRVVLARLPDDPAACAP